MRTADQGDVEVLGQRHLPAPRAVVLPARLGEVVGGGCECVLIGVPDVLLAIGVPVDGIGDIGRGNELRVAEGRRPGAGEVLRLDDAGFQNLEGGDQLLVAIGLAAAGIGQRCQRSHDTHRALELAEVRLHAPDAEQDVAVDTILGLDGGEQLGVVLGLLLAGVDARRGHRLDKIIRGGGSEFRLVLGELQHHGIGFGDAGEGGIEQLFRDARLLHARPQRVLDEGHELGVVGKCWLGQQGRKHEKRGEAPTVHVIPMIRPRPVRAPRYSTAKRFSRKMRPQSGISPGRWCCAGPACAPRRGRFPR